MSTWNVSNKLKDKILSETKKLDKNEVRILYLLRNLGPQRFTNLIEFSNLSRSTVSKYLKYHLSQNNVEKKIYNDKTNNLQEQRYFITELGIEKLNEEHYNKAHSLYFNELNSYISQMSDLVKFYKEIGVAESIIYQIVRTTSKIGDNFFLLDQNREFYLALFYIFLNSVLTRDYKFEINEFCKHYTVKKLRIDFYVDKIMSNKLGFYMFTRGEDIFFFHEEDILGTTTMRLIKDKLIKEIIQINLNGYRKVYDLDMVAEKIVEILVKMDLIWEANIEKNLTSIREPFEMLIEKILIRTALDMGFSKTFLMDIVLQSEKMLKSREGIKSLINIIEGSDRYEDLNLVSISDSKEIELDEILRRIQGFCPRCGKTILEKDLSNLCSKCGEKFRTNELVRDIDTANEISMRFKQQTLKEEQLIECPNPDCSYYVKSSWDVCPKCSTPIRKNKRLSD